MRIRHSARKHGIADDDIAHAARNPITIRPIDEDAPSHRFLVLGPDRAGNVLELILVIGDGPTGLIIHAMRVRPRYRDFLPRHVD